MKALAVALVLLFASPAIGDSWVFSRSTYTHRDGERTPRYHRPPRARPYIEWYYYEPYGPPRHYYYYAPPRRYGGRWYYRGGK